MLRIARREHRRVTRGEAKFGVTGGRTWAGDGRVTGRAVAHVKGRFGKSSHARHSSQASTVTRQSTRSASSAQGSPSAAAAARSCCSSVTNSRCRGGLDHDDVRARPAESLAHHPLSCHPCARAVSAGRWRRASHGGGNPRSSVAIRIRLARTTRPATITTTAGAGRPSRSPTSQASSKSQRS